MYVVTMIKKKVQNRHLFTPGKIYAMSFAILATFLSLKLYEKKKKKIKKIKKKKKSYKKKKE